MVNKVKVVLERDGAALSSEIAIKLESEFGLTNAAARKQISRGFAGMKKLAYLNFPKKVKFVYLEKDYNSSTYWSALESALRNANSAYSWAYWSVKCRDGIVPEGHFVAVCGSPMKQKGHLAAEKILENLLLAKILVRKNIPSLGDCLVLGYLVKENSVGLYKSAILSVYSRLYVEKQLVLPALKSWLKNAGLVSYNKVAVRTLESSPIVSTFQWDITAPSYLRVFSNWNASQEKPNPGFVTCDVLLRSVDENSIKPFLKKCETLSNLRTKTAFFHVLVVDEYTKEALHAAKSSGLVLSGTTENFFGKRISDGIKLLEGLIEESRNEVVTNKKKYIELIKIFDQFQGVYGNLKGTLFEMFCAQVVREIYRPKELITNMLIKNKQYDGGSHHLGDAEIDVYANITGYEHLFIECKGYLPGSTISHESIEKWVKERIPRTMEWLKRSDKLRDSTVRFELWITCDLPEESSNLIAKVAEKVPKYNLSVKKLDDISKEVERTRSKELKSVFKGVFRKDPLFKVKKKLSSLKEDDVPF